MRVGRVLVTGSEGFTGRYVCASLKKKGWDVWRSGVKAVRSTSNYVMTDLTNEAQAKRLIDQARPNVVIHLAALAFVGDNDAGAFHRVNVMGTQYLLEALATQPRPPDCVILASSANVYGNTTSGILSERTITAPTNEYALSKLAMEIMAKEWMSSLPIVITRPFNYSGRHQESRFLIPKIVNHLRYRAEAIELGNLDIGRDYSDVRDVARAYTALAEIQPTGETVNLCSGTSYSLQEILAMGEAISGHSLRVDVNPDFVRQNEVHWLQGDRGKLERLLGYWDPITLPETLRWMLEDSSGI